MPFPDPPYPYAPLAIVTTRGGVVVKVEDRRIRDPSRAGVYRNDADPSNVVRVTAGDVLLSDGTVVRYDPTTRTGLRGGAPNTDNLYGYPQTWPAVADGELRVSIGSWRFSSVPLGGSGVVTAYFWWHRYAEGGLQLMAANYGTAWPTTGVIGKAATVQFNAINRLNATHTDSDYTAGTVLSVADARPSFGV